MIATDWRTPREGDTEHAAAERLDALGALPYPVHVTDFDYTARNAWMRALAAYLAECGVSIEATNASGSTFYAERLNYIDAKGQCVPRGPLFWCCDNGGEVSGALANIEGTHFDVPTDVCGGGRPIEAVATALLDAVDARTFKIRQTAAQQARTAARRKARAKAA